MFGSTFPSEVFGGFLRMSCWRVWILRVVSLALPGQSPKDLTYLAHDRHSTYTNTWCRLFRHKSTKPPGFDPNDYQLGCF